MTRKPQSIVYRWDDQIGVSPAWHVTAEDSAGVVTDSQKIDFPVAVEDFGRDEERELVAALREAFPGAYVYAWVGI